MKLIDDNNFLDVQISWFEKQVMNDLIDNWEVTGVSEKDNKIKECLKDHISLRHEDLPGLRELLSIQGLKKLSNTIASAKKRNNSKKESLQLMLDKSVISGLKESAKNRGMSISELIAAGDANNKEINTEAKVALKGLIRYYATSENKVLEKLLVEAQNRTVQEIAEKLPSSTSQNEALAIFFGDN